MSPMTRLADRLARTAARWRAGTLAERALDAAVYGDCARGHEITERLIARRPAAAEVLAGAWCEAILADMPPAFRRSPMPLQPVVVNETGLLAPEHAPAPVLWAARLVVARAKYDQPMFQALIDAVPADEMDLHLAGLLHAAAAAVVERGERTAL